MLQGKPGAEGKIKINVVSWSAPISYQNQVHSGSSTIPDDTQKGTITVTTQKLQVEDLGVYWCAHCTCSFFSQIIEIKLSVSKSISF